MGDCKQKYIAWSLENGCYCGEYENGGLIGADARNEFDGWEAAWQHQQAIIDNLRSQLNNMEQCYVEKKKQVEAVSQVLCELKESMSGFQEMDLYDKGHRVAVEYVIVDLEKALRGDSDQLLNR